MSIRVTLHFHIKADKTEELTQFLSLNLPNVRRFPGCLYVDVLFNEDKNEMLLEEQWQTKGHHQEYFEFIKGNGILAELSDFMLKEPQVGYFEKSTL